MAAASPPDPTRSRRRRRLPALLALALTLLGSRSLQASSGACEAFGKDIEIVEKPGGRFVGDFNGDGVVDELFFLKLGESAEAGEGVKTQNPWSAKRPPFSPGSVALGIAHRIRGRQACRRFILSHPDFFSSPIWQDPASTPLSIVKKKSPKLRGRVRGLKGDAILLGTEAGSDIVLFWDGKSYVVRWGADVP